MSSNNQYELSFAFSKAPEAGQLQEILPGVDWVRLPLPFALDHVNCWLLNSATESCLVDTGVNMPDSLNCWDSVFKQRALPQKLLVTHFHPDHSGLSGWFANQDTQVLTSEIEWRVVTQLNSIQTLDYQNFYVKWYQQHGIPAGYIEAVSKAGNTYKRITAPPADNPQFVKAGDKLELAGRSYTVMTGQGHAPDMIMLYCEADQFLIAADQILPSITPNVSLTPNVSDPNPLGSFLDCIERLRALPKETLVLPSHGLPFRGLHQRIDFLQEHHRLRLTEIEQALSVERNANDLFTVLFKRKLDNQQMSFALGETLAHVKYLELESRVVETVRDGLSFFRAIPA